MKFGRIVLAGIAVGILNAIWGFLTCGWLFNWVYALEPTYVWKTMEEMPLILANIAGIVFAILLAWVYALIKNGLPGRGMVKGLWFGLCVWLVGALPGNFALGMFMAINPTVIIYWIISTLILGLLEGVVIAAIYK